MTPIPVLGLGTDTMVTLLIFVKMRADTMTPIRIFGLGTDTGVSRLVLVKCVLIP